MKDFLSKKAKLIYLLCGVLSLLTLILGVAFMSQYRNIRVNYTIVKNQVTGQERIVIGPTETMNGGNQMAVFEFFTRLGTGQLDELDAYKAHPELKELKEKYMSGAELTDESKMLVYNYKNKLDNYNNMIILFSVLSLVSFALMMVFSNQSRKIYYKSNLISGIVLPGIIIVLNLILIIMSFGLMSELSANYTYFNIVSVLQNPVNAKLADAAITVETNNKNINQIFELFNCNSLTFVLYDLLFALSLLYSAFLIAFAVLKYKWTAERRAEVIANSKIVGELI